MSGEFVEGGDSEHGVERALVARSPAVRGRCLLARRGRRRKPSTLDVNPESQNYVGGSVGLMVDGVCG